MIDFDKLKIAHELAYNSDSYYFEISLGMDGGGITIYDAHRNDCQDIYYTECLDNLIAKLSELTAPPPKFVKAQLVWLVVNNEIIQESIIEARHDSYGWWYRLQKGIAREEALYDKVPAIHAVLERKQEECQHESDGQPHIKEFNNGFNSGFGMQKKCKKCGEFYK